MNNIQGKNGIVFMGNAIYSLNGIYNLRCFLTIYYSLFVMTARVVINKTQFKLARGTFTLHLFERFHSIIPAIG